MQMWLMYISVDSRVPGRLKTRAFTSSSQQIDGDTPDPDESSRQDRSIDGDLR